MNKALAVRVVKAVLLAPLRKLAPNGVGDAVVNAAGKVLGVAHKTNPSGNNMSQR